MRGREVEHPGPGPHRPDPAPASGDLTAGTQDDTRHGVTNRYAALVVASGKVITEMTARHRAIEFKRFLTRIDQAVPAGLAVHVICDNFSTHKTPAIQRGSHRSVAEVATSDPGPDRHWNDNPRPFAWTKTADQILDTIATYCQRINDSGH